MNRHHHLSPFGRPGIWDYAYDVDHRSDDEKLADAMAEVIAAAAERSKLTSTPGDIPEDKLGRAEARFLNAEAVFTRLVEDATNQPFDKLHAAMVLCSDRGVVR